MSWLFYAVLSVFIWSLIAIGDKLILNRWIKKSSTMLVIYGIVGIIFGSFVFAIKGFVLLSLGDIILTLIAGTLCVTTHVLFFKAVKEEEVSRVIPLMYISPIFSIFFARVFVGEILGLLQYLGILFLIVGAVAVSTHDIKHMRFNKVFFMMVIVAVSMSLFAIAVKLMSANAGVWTIFAYTRFGMLPGLLILFFMDYKELKRIYLDHGLGAYAAITLNETLNCVGALTFIVATATGFVTIVNAILSFEPFVVFFLTLIFSYFLPQLLEEEHTRNTIIQKAIAIVFVIVGGLIVL